MATAISKFNTWLFRFATKKEHFPDPWSTALNSIFTSSKSLSSEVLTGTTLSSEEVGMCTGPIGCNIVRAIHAMRAGKHTVTISGDGDKIIVEYHSDKGTVELIVYSMSTKTISGGILKQDETGVIENVTPINIESRSAADSSSGVSVMIALMTAVVLGGANPHAEEVARYIGHILRRTNDQDLDTHDNTLFWFALLHTRMYKVMAPSSPSHDNWIGAALDGVSPSGVLQRVTAEEIYQLSEDAMPIGFATLPSGHSPFAKDALIAIQECMAPMDGFADSTLSGETTAVVGTALDELREELKLDIHKLTKAEISMIPRLGDNYVVDATLLEAARIIKRDWKCPGVDLAPNFILEGDAGSGKTAASKFFADVFGIPRTKMTMHPLFESSNLIGAFYPVFQDLDDMALSEEDKAAISVMERHMAVASEGDIPHDTTTLLRACRRTLEEPGVTDEIASAYGIPSWEECQLDTEESWEALGFSTPTPAASEVVKAAEKAKQAKIYRLMSLLCEQVEGNSVSYRFILSELLRAFQHGWLVEVQEAASVLRPGVLTELNSLLEKGGRIELPNGKFITRHPDTIVVFTTNRDYAGNVDLNESLRDRCMMGIKMDLPPASVMAARAMQQTGFTDKDVAEQAAYTIMMISEEAKARNIRGSFGMRSLLGWMLDLRNGDFSEQAFRRRVIDKMTTRDDDISILMTCYRANCSFASRTARSGRS